jgi:hypothetical protein
VDYIQIRNAPDGAGSVVDTRTFGVDDTDEFYAAAYNHTVDYISDVDVIWTTTAATVGTVTTPGNYTTFEAQHVTTDSSCTVTANYNGITNLTGLLTVLAPTVDEIRIRTGASEGGSVLDTAMTMNVDDYDMYYAAGYNATVGYLTDITGASWGVTNTIGSVSYCICWRYFQ